VIITVVFEKNAKLFAENWQKSQKIVIITSVVGLRLECIVLQERAIYVCTYKSGDPYNRWKDENARFYFNWLNGSSIR
jgi:hypothetical protein